MKKILLLSAMLVAGAPHTSWGAIKTETVTYKQGGATLEGFAAWDDSLQDKRPGVLVVHEWMGITDFTRSEATRLAQLGYVAFAADIYGKGIRPATPEEAGKISGSYKSNRPLLRERAKAGLAVLQKMKTVDSNRIAATGYCFGGTTVLELARSGAPLLGVVSFHGGLSTPTPGDAKNIKGKVLALAGGDDPHVPKEEVAAFVDEMKTGNVDWQLVQYGGAVHSFTNPGAGNDPSQGAAYNEKAAKRSWEAMKTFLAETFQTTAK